MERSSRKRDGDLLGGGAAVASKDRFLRSKSTIDVLHPICESRKADLNIERNSSLGKRNGKKREGGRNLRGTKSAPGVLTRAGDASSQSSGKTRSAGSRGGSRLRAHEASTPEKNPNRFGTTSRVAQQQVLRGPRRALKTPTAPINEAVGPRDGSMPRVDPKKAGGSGAGGGPLAPKSDVDVLMATAERLSKYRESTGSAPKRACANLAKKNMNTHATALSGGTQPDTILLAQRAQNICDNYKSAIAHLEKYKLLADGYHDIESSEIGTS